MRHVIISGLTASGKTTQSLHLVKDLGLNYISGSAIRSELLGIAEHVSSNHQFWRESTSAESLDKARLARADAQDMAVDDELIEIAGKHNRCVFDAWVMPWLFQKDSLCILLKSSLQTRARRVFRNSGQEAFDNVLRRVEQKDKRSREFFLVTYNVDVFHDLSPFDVIIECNERDDEATDSIAEISDQLSPIVRSALSGDREGLRQVLRSINQRLRLAQMFVRPNLFDRIAQVVPA